MYDHTYDFALSAAQADELEKIALAAGWGRAIGALGGAATGATYGATSSPDQPITGALKGALVGGAVGLAGGQLATAQGQRQIQRFGQRQLHGATGYLPGRGIFGTGASGTKWYQRGKKVDLTPEQRVGGLEQMKWDLPKGKTREEMRDIAEKDLSGGIVSKYLPESVRKFWANRRSAAEVSRKRLAEEGMTNIPGVVKGYLGKSPSKISPLEAAKLNLTEPGLAMGVGLPLAFTAQSVQDYRNTGDVKQLGKDVASNVGLGLTGGLPILGSLAVGEIVGRGGALVGRGVEKLKGTPPQAAARPGTPTRIPTSPAAVQAARRAAPNLRGRDV